ncbi:mannose-1-phosphate guanylyltransferase/mannose-6-phosphate isomerase [Sphingomonas naphthae]|uniref:Mannose-1-phosphate guanylyltransferase/mannose-6-phosphate isomerase n=1 Tax=Sphingomonas naphthae TaxID=1813468 RepID=A0ABY7TK61_9SPHN|nr:mannose-1-phosphate guanylyltransferase/mannose-6-phosphate isomerase [Sphingomonas naphthae]WCT73621.1 mannose-1-phosphate guanylyltransferase/mannose-6-phosphate isomerase [Sphingomonas naphthae]
MTSHITPVILSGGSGTRLWPMSRAAKPKQLLALTSTDSMLQLTARRSSDDTRFDRPLVVGNARHAEMIEEQLEAISLPAASLVLEPAGRNTAPAIALAALLTRPDAILLVMPSDHVINDVSAFRAAIETAVPLVEDGWLVTFGIAPTAPDTGYGYIRRGETLAPGIERVEKFVEKPDRATAEAYLAEGCYSWNGGIFLFRADAYLVELGRHAPEMLAAVRESLDKGVRQGQRVYPEEAAFKAAPSDSIDYAVMEKADRVAVVPVDMGWSDVGSWDALHEIAPRDEAGNAEHGEIVSIDTSNCLLRTDGPLVAAIGVKDLIVIATGDAVLIMPRGSSQDVKRAIEKLKASGHVTLDRSSL